jgi:hypothetical protein
VEIIVTFLQSANHFLQAALSASQTLPPPNENAETVLSSSNRVHMSWLIEFVSLLHHVASLIINSRKSTLLVSFIARGGLTCISELASVLCQLAQCFSSNTTAVVKVQESLASCCKCYVCALDCTSASTCPASHTLKLLSDVWLHACDSESKAQRSALIFTAVAVSRHGSETLKNLTTTQIRLASIVQIVVSHVETAHTLIVADDVAAEQEVVAKSACQVLCAYLSTHPDLSSTLVPSNILPRLCNIGWSWMRPSVPSSHAERISSMVDMRLRPVVAALASHVVGELLHLQNSSTWLELVIHLLETNASDVCDVFAADLAAAAADQRIDAVQYSTRLLHYATICSMCGSCQVSDEVEMAWSFGMGLLFDESWDSCPAASHSLLFQRYYLHTVFVSRHVMSKAAVSAAAFSDLVRGALIPTDGGCAASLSLAMMICSSETDSGSDEVLRLDHVKIPDNFADELMDTLEKLPSPQTSGCALQISVLFSIGYTMNWKIAAEEEWRRRCCSFYSAFLTSDSPMQHVLLQTISETVVSHLNTLPESLPSALIFRSRQLQNDILTPFGPSFLLQINSCLEKGMVAPALLEPLLTNIIKVVSSDASENRLLTRTLVCALAAASCIAPSVVAQEILNVAALCHSAQRHVLRALASAAARGEFDLEIFQSLELLCRFSASEFLISEGMLAHFLKSFDSGVGIVTVKYISMIMRHAFDSKYASSSWTHCMMVVSRIILHGEFSVLLIQNDTVVVLTELVTHLISVNCWVSPEVMSRISCILSSALQHLSIIPITNFLDALLPVAPAFDATAWCQEFILVTLRCCGCSLVTDSSFLQLAASRIIFTISQQHVSVLASTSLVCHLVEALVSCMTNSDTAALMARSFLNIAAVAPCLLHDSCPISLSTIPLDVMLRLSPDALASVVQCKN